MGGLNRVTQKIFGSTSGFEQVTQVGSFAAGSTVYSTDPATIMALSNYLDGWFSCVIGDNAPCIEDMNGLFFVITTQLAYILERGVPGWDNGTTYNTGDMVSLNSIIYVSLQDTNLNQNPTTAITFWKVLVTNPFTTLGDTLYSLANGVPQRLAGNTSATPAFLTQTGTGSASAAPVWRSLLSPTVSVATASGAGTGGFATTTSQAGYLFTISASMTCAVGDTYTNNGNTYTVAGALSSQTGQVLFTTGTGAPLSSGTLTRTSGSGTASVTYTLATPLYTYTLPTANTPLYLKVRLVGGGAGGSGTNGPTTIAGADGNSTNFGTLLVQAGGGIASTTGGTGGVVNYNSGPWTGSSVLSIMKAIPGQAGQGTSFMGAAGTSTAGGAGAQTSFGGAGMGAPAAMSGQNATPNTGSGGGGCGTFSGTDSNGAGGASAGEFEFIMPAAALKATFLYNIGTGGAGGFSSLNGGGGAEGSIIIEEYYQ